MVEYKILLSESIWNEIKQYKKDLINEKTKPGAYLQKQICDLTELTVNDLNTQEFIQLLLKTKKPKIFATEEVLGDGSDWNQIEFKILGDISISMDVEVYDNGVWFVSDEGFQVYESPFRANLLFTPGPLLRGRKGITIPDLEEIKSSDGIDQVKYNALIERRLLPAFAYANLDAGNKNKRAVIVLPGLGCGEFAGKFKGEMGEHLNKALVYVLEKNGDKLPNVSCIHYDPYLECENSELKIYNIDYRVRLLNSSLGKPQLSKVEDLEEYKNEFKDCILYKVVAWDHFSYPGNDYFLGVRITDGVSAAATNSMEVITGVTGKYEIGYYFTPSGSKGWKTVTDDYNSYIIANGNIYVTFSDGKCIRVE